MLNIFVNSKRIDYDDDNRCGLLQKLDNETEQDSPRNLSLKNAKQI